MELLRDADIDPAPLAGKRVAIIGFGNQGRAQALNLQGSGIDVVVGLRSGSPSAAEVQAAGLDTDLVEQAAASADVAMLLAPDEKLGAIYAAIEPHLHPGAALGFSHGLAVHFGLVVPRDDLAVFMVAPKGPGTALRALYQAGEGMIALWAGARDLALAYGRAIGCGRAGLIASSFAEECEADLFNEQAVVWSAVPEVLIAELIEARGIAGMREAISNTAELGATLGGRRIIDQGVRARMAEVLAEVRAGRFAHALGKEEAAGYPLLRQAREAARSLPVERALRKLRPDAG